MKWFEYQMEVDEPKSARRAESPPCWPWNPNRNAQPAPLNPARAAKRKAVPWHSPAGSGGRSVWRPARAVVFLGSQVVQLGGLSTMNLFAAGGAASSTAMASVPSTAQYSIAEDNSLEAGSTRSMTEGSSAVAEIKSSTPPT